LPSTTIVFFNGNDQQFLSINNVYLSRQHVKGHPLISLDNYNTGDLLFGQLQRIPSSIMATALCRRIRGQIEAGQRAMPMDQWMN
jgi:hypothetical protein